MTPHIYVDRRLGAKRVFELHEDRLVLTGTRILGNRYSITVPLIDVDPNYSRHWVKDGFYRNLAAAICIPLFALLCLSVFVIGPYLDHVHWVVIAAVPIGLLAAPVVVGLLPIRYEAYLFSLRSGVHSFAIRKVGANAASFDSFISALLACIHVCRPAP